ENPELALAAREAGITFIGPSKEALDMAGNKVAAKQYAIDAGVPVLRSTDPTTDIDALIARADEIGYPVFAKAVRGGGGRARCRVEKREVLRDAIEGARREAESAFRDATVFIEQAVLRPRHIAGQVLADRPGECVHLFERDCSVPRRHQK